MKNDQMRFYTHGTAALDVNEIARHEENALVASQPSSNIVKFPVYEDADSEQVKNIFSYADAAAPSYWQIARDAFGPQEVTTRMNNYSSVYKNIEFKVIDKVLLVAAFLITAIVVAF